MGDVSPDIEMLSKSIILKQTDASVLVPYIISPSLTERMKDNQIKMLAVFRRGAGMGFNGLCWNLPPPVKTFGIVLCNCLVNSNYRCHAGLGTMSVIIR